ncbi:MAG TPA: hypothetical protein VFS46_05670 [Nitrososphaera sp.]|nr:hypothetical protein [Nitrososphaera sp.]
MATEKSSKRYFIGAAISGLALFLFMQGAGILNVQSIYADSRTSVTVSPFFQLPGSSVVVRADGLAPNAEATIYVKNVVARVETMKAGESASVVTFPDQIVVGTTETISTGSLEWALGVPKDDVTVIERWISNSTGQVLKTVTTTYKFQGTVKVIVVDQFGNSASGELTVIRWITGSPF